MPPKSPHKNNPRNIGIQIKQNILDHFRGDFTGFYSQYLPDLKSGKANCPFHDCDSRSFSVNLKNGLFKCHVPNCGVTGDIFKFYALKHNLNGDFSAVLRGLATDFSISEKSAKPGRLAKPIRRYPYHGLDGAVLYFKNRFDPKGFSISRPDSKGGFIAGLGGTFPVLYNLPAVVKANKVFVVEGEKDADSMNALGFTATTNFDGAGKWKDSYTGVLRGKNVFIIPDDDQSGHKHAQLVAASLHGVATSLRIIILPNPTNVKGFDVSDFIGGFKDPNTAAQRLSHLAEEAPEWVPPAESERNLEIPSSFQFIHNAEILADLRPIEWRIRDILPDQSLYYSFGYPGCFKTFIELDRLLSIASGIDYHGHKVKQGAVFYICGEGWHNIGRRITAWHAAHKTKAADVPFFVAKVPTQLMDPAVLDNVKRAVDSLAAKYGSAAVVSIDTLARNFGEGDENSTTDMNRVISNLGQAFWNEFCRGVVTHTGHADKTRARGSTALHGAADAAFRVDLISTGQIMVECKKMKDAPSAPLMVFDRREVLFQIGATQDRSLVLELRAEGDGACSLVKLTKAVELKGGLRKALDVLQRLYARYEEKLRKQGRHCATPSVSFTEWRTACMDAALYKRTDNFKTAAEKLHRHGLIKFDAAKKNAYLADMVIKDDN
jgi:hypothetical protein